MQISACKQGRTGTSNPPPPRPVSLLLKAKRKKCFLGRLIAILAKERVSQKKWFCIRNCNENDIEISSAAYGSISTIGMVVLIYNDLMYGLYSKEVKDSNQIKTGRHPTFNN